MKNEKLMTGFTRTHYYKVRTALAHSFSLFIICFSLTYFTRIFGKNNQYYSVRQSNRKKDEKKGSFLKISLDTCDIFCNNNRV